jgi:hypothetical protein
VCTEVGLSGTGTWVSISTLQSIKEAWNAAGTFMYLLCVNCVGYATENKKTWDCHERRIADLKQTFLSTVNGQSRT